MRPELTLHITDDGTHLLIIRPNPIWKAEPKTITVTKEEALAIHEWRARGTTIQSVLPHWDAAQRELLLTGMDQKEWDDYLGNSEDD
jgi:hypothetical protein